MDIYNITKGRDEEVGKNNFFRNKMEEAYGEKVGGAIYETCDLAVSITAFKVPTPQKLAKVSSSTIINRKFKIVENNIKAYTGINELKNIFSKGYSINYYKLIIPANTIRGYADKFVMIFDGR